MNINSTNLNFMSDIDCPERSSCIGNEFILPFYCKKDNKSICSLYTICDVMVYVMVNSVINRIKMM